MDLINTIGRRKTSVARLYMTSGKGKIEINGREFAEYFPTGVLQAIAKEPLKIVDQLETYDLSINVKGGGVKGQAEAIRLAISRALCEVDSEFRPPLKQEGFLTRDSRMVERKKPGRKKARKQFQFSKR